MCEMRILGFNIMEVSKVIGSRWRTLDNEAKSYYQDKSSILKTKYQFYFSEFKQKGYYIINDEDKKDS